MLLRSSDIAAGPALHAINFAVFVRSHYAISSGSALLSSNSRLLLFQLLFFFFADLAIAYTALNAAFLASVGSPFFSRTLRQTRACEHY
jgi:hypothetical protein